MAKADEVVTKKKSSKNEAGSTGKSRRESVGSGHIKLNNAQVILFTDELSDFLHSGLQLEPALQLMENRDERTPVKTVSAFLREKVRDGTSFSEALRVASPNFDELYCNLVAAGEVSGAMAPLLQRQAVHLVAMQELRRRVQLALYYPAALVLAGLGALVVFMTVLVPQMTKLFARNRRRHAAAHPHSRQEQRIRPRVRHLRRAAIVAIGVTVFMITIRQPAGRRWWDEAKLKIPLMGPLLQDAFNAQFCQIMANLLQNGLPLLTALKLMSRATGNVFYHSLLLRICDYVGEGASLTARHENRRPFSRQPARLGQGRRTNRRPSVPRSKKSAHATKKSSSSVSTASCPSSRSSSSSAA